MVVRLSVASALTFEGRRVTLFGAWKLTRGMFWKMLGVYALCWLLAVVAMLLVLTIGMAAAALLGGGTDWLKFMTSQDFTSVGRYFTPSRFAFIVINALGAGLIWPVVYMPPAEIYRRIRPSDAA